MREDKVFDAALKTFREMRDEAAKRYLELSRNTLLKSCNLSLEFTQTNDVSKAIEAATLAGKAQAYAEVAETFRRKDK